MGGGKIKIQEQWKQKQKRLGKPYKVMETIPHTQTKYLTLIGKCSAAAMKLVYPKRRKYQNPKGWFFVDPAMHEFKPTDKFLAEGHGEFTTYWAILILTEIHLPTSGRAFEGTPIGWSTICHFDCHANWPEQTIDLETIDYFGPHKPGVTIYLVDRTDADE